MYKVKFNLKIQEYLSWYFKLYREYYENLYKDSWLWNESQIITWYINESIKRKEEIIYLIAYKISSENILWRTLENTIIINWRTKYIFIEWDENIDLKTRYIISIEIR